MGEIDDALQRAAANTATRPIPKSAQARMRFLLKTERGSTRALAARLGITQRTVERYLKGTLRRPRAELAARLEREVRKDWQPRVQRRAKKQAATATGIVIETRARFGFTAAPGSTDDARIRRITQHFPALARRLNPQADLPVRQRITRATLAGFVVCGLHPKVFPIAIAAGHQLLQITDRSERVVGIVVFAVIAVVPALAPAVIEMVSPGASSRIKDGYERIMKVHGRWIIAVLLLAAAAFVGHNALEHMPKH